MPIVFSILSLTLLGLSTVSPAAEASSTLLATQVSSDTNGMSECIQGDIVEGEVEVFNECSGFRGAVNEAQNRREFFYDFPAGTLTVYTEFDPPPGRFPDGVLMPDGRRSRSYYINQMFFNDREIDIQAILTSDRRTRFRCYITDDYAKATCDLPDGTWAQYEQ